jgi:hypothetical protein
MYAMSVPETPIVKVTASALSQVAANTRLKERGKKPSARKTLIVRAISFVRDPVTVKTLVRILLISTLTPPKRFHRLKENQHRMSKVVTKLVILKTHQNRKRDTAIFRKMGWEAQCI